MISEKISRGNKTRISNLEKTLINDGKWSVAMLARAGNSSTSNVRRTLKNKRVEPAERVQRRWLVRPVDVYTEQQLENAGLMLRVAAPVDFGAVPEAT